VALGSEQSHSSTQKAANILGVRYRSVRAGMETELVMTGANLRKKIRDLEKQGLVPFYVTATLGTTATCAVDDFEGIAQVRKEYPNLWVHIDAAYAGAALVCEEYREGAKAKWLSEVDSFDMNLHKWLLVNFDARYVSLPNLPYDQPTQAKAASSSAPARHLRPPCPSPHPTSSTPPPFPAA